MSRLPRIPQLNKGGWARFAGYAALVISAVVTGLALWLGWDIERIAASVTALLAVFTGTTASFNIERAPDQGQPRLADILTRVSELADAVSDYREPVPAPEHRHEVAYRHDKPHWN